MNYKKLFSIVIIFQFIFTISRCYDDFKNIVFLEKNKTNSNETQTDEYKEDGAIEYEYYSNFIPTKSYDKCPPDNDECPDDFKGYSDPEYNHSDCTFIGRGYHDNMLCDIYECKDIYNIYSNWERYVWNSYYDWCVDAGPCSVFAYSNTELRNEYRNCEVPCDPRPCVPNTCVKCSLNTCP